MSTTRKPLQNIAWLVGERIGRAAVTATVLAAVARYLEPAQFGQLNFAIALLAIVAPLATLGLEGIVVAELIQRPRQIGAVLATACWLRLLGGAITLGLVGVAIAFTPPSLVELQLLGIIALNLLLQPAEVIDLWFQSHLDSRRTVLARSVALLAGAVLKLSLVARGASLPAFALAQVADYVFFALALAWAGARGPHRAGAWQWDREIAGVLWRRGLPLALANTAFILSSRMDQLLVRSWLGEVNAGIYFAASRLSEVAVFAGMATALSLFPTLAASQKHSPAEFQGRLQGVFDVMSALGWVVAIGCTLLAEPITALLYGPAFAGAAPILVCQGWTCLFIFNGTARWQFVLLSRTTTLNMLTAAVHLAVIFAVGGWLIPQFGTLGAALASLTAFALSCYATSFVFPSLRSSVGVQTRGFLIAFSPRRWRSMFQLLHG